MGHNESVEVASMKNEIFSVTYWLHAWRLVALCAALILAGAAWFLLFKPDAQRQAGGEWAAVRADTNRQPILLDGRLEPATAINITAPFDGRVIKMLVRTGDKVEVCAPLLEIASNDLLAEDREVEASMIRAQQALDQVAHWNTSTEMLAAQRQLSSSKTTYERAQRSYVEVKGLFDKGIVSRNELETTQNEASSAQEQVSAAADNLVVVREKGGALQRKLMQLDLDNRRAKLADVEDKLSRAIVTAPIAGVVLYPAPQTSVMGNPVKETEVGSFVTSKDTLMTIGDTTHLAVRVALDEFDILRVKPGLPVEVTLNSNNDIKLDAEVVRVSSQAKSVGVLEGSNRAPTFELEVLIRDIAPEIRASLRIGMSVRMQIKLEVGESSLLVPLGAIVMATDGSAQVLQRTPGAKSGVSVNVKLGRTLLDEVEVESGLSAQDEVWVAQGSAANNKALEKDAEEKPGLPGLNFTNE